MQAKTRRVMRLLTRLADQALIAALIGRVERCGSEKGRPGIERHELLAVRDFLTRAPVDPMWPGDVPWLGRGAGNDSRGTAAAGDPDADPDNSPTALSGDCSGSLRTVAGTSGSGTRLRTSFSTSRLDLWRDAAMNSSRFSALR